MFNLLNKACAEEEDKRRAVDDVGSKLLSMEIFKKMLQQESPTAPS